MSTHRFLVKFKISGVAEKAMYSSPSNRACSNSPVKFRRGGYGLPQVGGGSVGGGVVGRSVGMTFRPGDTPASDTRLLRPEKMFTILKKNKTQMCFRS